jgi:hypothetical protein
MSGLQRSDGLLARHAWKGIEELVEAVIPLEIIDEIAKWYPRPDEHGCAAEDSGIAVNNRRTRGHA